MPFPSETALSRLYDLLRSGRALTYEQIEEELGISTRQARRHLRRLQDEDVPVQEEREEGSKTFFLPPEELHLEHSELPFTERQALALVVAVEAARSVLKPTPLARPLDEAFDQLLGPLAAAAHTYDLDRIRTHWHFEHTPMTESVDPDVFDTLVRAVNETRSIRVNYYTASTDTFREGRKIDPLHLAVTGRTWMCAAYCHLRDGVRDFALHRMENARLCDPDEETATFAPPEGFDSEVYYREHFGGLTDEEVELVRLLVEPDQASYFRDREHHPTQVIEEERDDGRIVVSFEVGGLEGFTSFVRSWGDGVTVLEPPELVDRIREEIEALHQRYQHADAPGTAQ